MAVMISYLHLSERVLMNRPPVPTRLIAFALLLALCSSFLLFSGGSVHANGSAIDKCSPDLLKIAESNGGSRVKAIVQSSGSSSLLDSLIQSFGGIVLATFPLLNVRLVDITAGDALALAYNDEISFMSLDNQVRSYGHLTTTI